ncbi:hypothetical protein OHA_3_00021 (plasmid) [Pleomorphomonas sp. SM30]|nr:hypothetical protein OHA_3_00021 [Pleomorphomonas sp. SM30]
MHALRAAVLEPGIFPNEAAIAWLVGAILLKQNDEWAVQRARYMILETITAHGDDPLVGLPDMAVQRASRPSRRPSVIAQATTPRLGIRSTSAELPKGFRDLRGVGAAEAALVDRGGLLASRIRCPIPQGGAGSLCHECRPCQHGGRWQ